MTKQAVIYARVSSQGQGDNYSIPTQLEGCRKYASERGYKVTAEFTDQFTGTELDRPGLSELEEYVHRHKVPVLIVYDIDRLSRINRFQAVLEIEIEKLGATVEYVIGNYDGSAEGTLTKHMKAAIAEYELRQRAERVRRGRDGKLRAGYVFLTHLHTPYGYAYVSEPHKGSLALQESEAPVVRQIYAWVLEGRSSYDIARMLTEEGVPTRGDKAEGLSKKSAFGAWTPSVVRRIIHNPVNKGQWTYGKTRAAKSGGKTRQVKGNPAQQIVVAVPAIVSEEQWQEAQTRLQLNKLNAKRNARHDFLLQGLIVCACGKRWTGAYRSHLKRAYYRCGSWSGPKWVATECPVQGGVQQERLEEAVWEKVCSTLLDGTYLRAELAQRKNTVTAELAEKRRRLAAVEAAIADIDRKLDMLLDQLLAGRFAASKIEKRQAQFAAQQQELEADAVRLQAEIDRAALTPEQEETVLAYAGRIREGTQGLGFSDKRRILELLSVRVEVIDQEHFRVTAMLPLCGADVTVQRPPRSATRKAVKPAEQTSDSSAATVQLVDSSSAPTPPRR